MNELAVIDVDELEKDLLALPQADFKTSHYFGPGVYIREVVLPAGIIAIGHHQKFSQLNIVLSGSVAMVDGDHVKTVTAPCIFTGPPGRKCGLVMTETVWLNVYPNPDNVTEIEKLESIWLEKSEGFVRSKENIEEDRDDYKSLILQAGLTEEMVRSQTENQLDQIDIPEGFIDFDVMKSCLEGVGVFLKSTTKAGDLIGPARINGLRTPLGRYVNHSKSPNAIFVKDANGDISLYALEDTNGEEITVDYRDALALSGVIIRRDR